MAINLTKPTAGTQIVQASKANEVIVFDFPTTDVTLNRIDDNLVFDFEDGSSISLTDFYSVYNSESMPTFDIEGAQIDGETFFTALNASDLMPAAGPAAAPVSADGSFFDGGLGANLIGGIDYLGGLDIPQATSSVEFEDQDGAFGGGQNQLPIVTGITVNPDDDHSIGEGNFAPDATPTVLDVYESGVGRDAGGKIDSGAPNLEYNGDITATGQINAFDPEGDTVSFTLEGDGQGTYGVITLNPETGEFEYSFRDTANNSLNQGEVVTESFNVVVSDQNGNSTTVSVTVQVNGTNDKPELSLGLTTDTVVNEDSTDTTVTGQLSVVDPDADGDTLAEQNITIEFEGITYTINTTLGEENTVIDGTYGRLTVSPDGSYEYTLGVTDAQKSEVDKLGGDIQNVTEDFVVTTTDAHGANDSKNLTININGVNDAPEIVPPSPTNPTDPNAPSDPNASTVDVAVRESGIGTNASGDEISGQLFDEGKINATDVDSSTLSFKIIDQAFGDGATESLGTFTLNPDGSYSFTLDDKKADSLSQDQVRTETYTIEVSDGHGGFTTQDVTVTITGTNDAPTLDIIATDNNVTENSTSDNTASGKIDFNDVDSNGSTLTVEGHNINRDEDGIITEPTTIEGTYGNLVVQPNGSYTYTAGVTDEQKAALDALGEGSSAATETFDVVNKDPHNVEVSGQININVTGVNDVPTIVTTKSDLSVNVDDSNLANGTNPDGSDFDQGKIVFKSVETMDGGKITFKIDQDGDGTLEDVTFDVNYDVTNGWTLSPASVDGQYGDFTFTLTGPSDGIGEFTLDYTYTQTESYDKHSDDTSDNEVQNSAEKLEVTIQDGKESAGSSEGLNATITVNINDDGPNVTDAYGWDSDKDSHYEAELGTGTDKKSVDLFDFEYGADEDGATITFTTDKDSEFTIENGSEVWYEGQKIGDIVVADGTVSFEFNMKVDGSTGNDFFTPDGIIPNVEFDFKITDGDNDVESGTVSVDIKNLEFTVTGSEVTIDDADSSSYTQTGSIDINGFDDIRSVTIGGKEVSFNSEGELVPNQQLEFDGYTVTVTGFDKDSGQLSYEVSIDEAYDHTNIDDTDDSDGITTNYTDKDGDGNSDIIIKLDITVNGGTSEGSPSLDIIIKDDAPTATDNAYTVKENATVEGNILTDKHNHDNDSSTPDAADNAGADGWKESGAIVDVTAPTTGTWDTLTGDDLTYEGNAYEFGFDSEIGTLYVDANGDYTFVGKDGVDVNTDITFSYTVEDKDGDKATANVTIAVENVDKTPTIETEGSDILVDDSSLPDGVDTPIADINNQGSLEFTLGDGELAEHTFIINIPNQDGTTSAHTLVFDDEGKATLDATAGKLTFELGADNTLSYTYEQTEAFDHDNELSESETNRAETDTAFSFTVTIKDKDSGEITSDQIDVNINDDGPKTSGAIDTDDNGIVDVTGTLKGAIVTATIDVDFGADGYGKIIIPKEFGGAATIDLVAIWNEETETWGPAPGAPWLDHLFDYDKETNTLKVGDVTFNMNADGTWTVSYKTDGEGNRDLALEFVDGDGDSVKHEIKGPELDSFTANVESDDDTPATDKDVFIKDDHLEEDQSLDIPEDGLDVKDEEGKVIGKLELDEDGNLEFTQTDNVTHPDGNGDSSTDITVKVPVVDKDGNTTGHVDVTITVGDALPDAKDDVDNNVDDGGNIIEGNITGNIFDNDEIGADGWQDENNKLEPDSVTPPDGWNEVPTDDVLEGYEFGFKDDNGNEIYFKDDGSYEFVPSDNLPAGETPFEFDYNITDGDGDSDETDAKLTITVTVENHKPEIEDPKDPSYPDEVVTDTKLDTDDSYLTDGTTPDNDKTSDNGQIVFKAEDSMDGGQITIGGKELTVSYDDASGQWVLSPTDSEGNIVIDGSYGHLTVDGLTYENGQFTLEYTYTQTDNYDIHSQKDNHNETQTSAERFDVTIQDYNDGNTIGDSAKTTISVDIKDDGPVIVSDDNGDGKTEVTVSTEIVDGVAKEFAETTLTVNFGADNPGTITIPNGSTYVSGVEWDAENGTWKPIANSWEPADAPTIQCHYNKELEQFEIRLGDTTLVSDDNVNWTVKFEVGKGFEIGDGKDSTTLTFTDGDGDSVKHTIEAKPEPKPEPEPEKEPTDIDSGNYNDTIFFRQGFNSVDIADTTGYVDGLPTTPIKDEVAYDGAGMTVNAGSGNDSVYMGSGDDTIYMGSGSEKEDINAHTAESVAKAQNAIDDFMKLSEAPENNTITYGSEDEALRNNDASSSFVDMAHGGGGDDKIYGEEGVDLLFGGSGNDYLDGGEGNDGLRGGTGNDFIDGGNGNDAIHGGEGADILVGGTGNDILFFDGSDVLAGGEGFDIAIGSADAIDKQLGTANGVELFIEEGSVNGTNMSDILFELGIQKDDDTLLLNDDWGTTGNVDGNYTEYTRPVGEGTQTIWIKTDSNVETAPKFSADFDPNKEFYEDLSSNDYQSDAMNVIVDTSINDNSDLAPGLPESLEEAMGGLEHIDLTSKVFMANNGLTHEGSSLVLDDSWESIGQDQYQNAETGLTLDGKNISIDDTNLNIDDTGL